MTISVKRPLSAQSEVVNTNRRWNQDWYSWLGDLTDTIGAIDTTSNGGSTTDLGIVNVKDFGADGRDRLYTNIVGGSGYTGGTANLVTAPEDYTDASWAPGSFTVISNAVVDPRGNLLADGLQEQVVASTKFEIRNNAGSFTAGNSVRVYVEVKPALRTWVRIGVWESAFASGFWSTFQLTGNGVIGSEFNFATAAYITKRTITPMANGFYLIMIEGTLDPGANTARVLITSLLGDVTTFSGSDTHEIFTGSGQVAFYLGRSQVCQVMKYKGTVYIASDNVYPGIAMTGGTGTNATANITVGMGQVLDVQSYAPGAGYVVSDTLSCANTNIGGTGSGFSCQVETLGDDTRAIQAALDSAADGPLTIFFPAGTYNVFPQDTIQSHCLYIRQGNLTLLGQGRDTTKISCFVSGGRHPETNWDVQPANNNMVWRGNGFVFPQPGQNVEFFRLRITGNCLRHNGAWPLGGGDPGVISFGNPLGSNGDGDGWDGTHHGISAEVNTGPVNLGIRIIDCEVDSWKGEIIVRNGDNVNPVGSGSATVGSAPTSWSFWIENCYIHDTNADALNTDGNAMVLNSELAWATNGLESNTTQSHLIFRGNSVHDCTHGVTLVVGTDSGANVTGTGQTVVSQNLIERCYLNGIFLLDFQVNTDVCDNILVDCGVTSSNTGGAIAATLISGHQPYANIYIRKNVIMNHTLAVQQGLQIQMSVFNGSSFTGVYVEDNKLALTPYAQANGNNFNSPFGVFVDANCQLEFLNNDFRIAAGDKQVSGTGILHLVRNNLYTGQSNYADVRLCAQFDKTSSVSLANIPGLAETLSKDRRAWFEALLLITAPAGGAKVAVVTSGTIVDMSYDVEMWAGTTVDAASGRGTASGTSFASAAAITKVRISGQISLNTAGNLTIQFAQNSSNGTPSSVLLGSWFKVRGQGS